MAFTSADGDQFIVECFERKLKRYLLIELEDKACESAIFEVIKIITERGLDFRGSSAEVNNFISSLHTVYQSMDGKGVDDIDVNINFYNIISTIGSRRLEDSDAYLVPLALLTSSKVRGSYEKFDKEVCEVVGTAIQAVKNKKKRKEPSE